MGRPRKWSTDAERQAAYRERRNVAQERLGHVVIRLHKATALHPELVCLSLQDDPVKALAGIADWLEAGWGLPFTAAAAEVRMAQSGCFDPMGGD